MKYKNATTEAIRVILNKEACFINPGQTQDFTDTEAASPSVANEIAAKRLVRFTSPTTSKTKE